MGYSYLYCAETCYLARSGSQIRLISRFCVRKYALFGKKSFANMRYFAKNHSQIRLISRFCVRKYTLFGVFRFANELKQYKQK
jgi:hypothetical protein